MARVLGSARFTITKCPVVSEVRTTGMIDRHAEINRMVQCRHQRILTTGLGHHAGDGDRQVGAGAIWLA